MPYLTAAYLAIRYGMTLNDGIAARINFNEIGVYCQQFLQEMQNGQLKEDHLYIVRADYLNYLTPQPKIHCQEIEDFTACTTEKMP